MEMGLRLRKSWTSLKPSSEMQKVLAILPAYNEEASIISLLKNFEPLAGEHSFSLSVLVVNDGSQDRTAEVVNQFKSTVPIEMLDNANNGGLGKVLRQGLQYAVHHLDKGDLVITMDADNSHNPNLIPRMVHQIRNGSDLVIASRYRSGARSYGLSFFRTCTSFLAGSLFMIFAPVKGVRDYTCGFRAYSVELLQQGFNHYGERLIEENGFSCMVELLLKLNRFKPKCHELPMILRYDLKQGSSKMKIRKTIQSTLNVLWQYHFGNRFK